MLAQLVSGHSAWTRPETGVSQGQAHCRLSPRTTTPSSTSQEQKTRPLSSKAVAVQLHLWASRITALRLVPANSQSPVPRADGCWLSPLLPAMRLQRGRAEISPDIQENLTQGKKPKQKTCPFPGLNSRCPRHHQDKLRPVPRTMKVKGIHKSRQYTCLCWGQGFVSRMCVFIMGYNHSTH